MSRKISAPPVQGEKCSLTSPFIEQAITPTTPVNECNGDFTPTNPDTDWFSSGEFYFFFWAAASAIACIRSMVG
jgi:hypothetical protein